MVVNVLYRTQQISAFGGLKPSFIQRCAESTIAFIHKIDSASPLKVLNKALATNGVNKKHLLERNVVLKAHGMTMILKEQK